MIKLLLLLIKSKAAITALSMLFSIAVYSMVFGWLFAFGFVLLMFLHEYGHYMAARHRGIDVGYIAFIPFIGAWTALDKLPQDAETNAFIGLAGPVAGTAASLACFLGGRYWGNDMLIALAYSGCVLNLLNLLTIAMLDGGRITAVISPRIWLVGAPLLGLLFIVYPSPMFLLILILSWPQLLAAWHGRHEELTYFNAPARTRLTYAVLYIGLIVLLSAASYLLHENLAAYQHR